MKELPESLYSQVYDLAERTALTVAPLFRLFGWTWVTAKDGIPTFTEVFDKLMELAADAIGDGSCLMSSCRLFAEYDDRCADGPALRMGLCDFITLGVAKDEGDDA